MIEFNREDPFPLLPDEAYTYKEQQQHSRLVDDWLGIRVEDSEKDVVPVDGHEYWAGLAPERLMTPYTEIRQILHKIQLRKGETVVDLGAAYGRFGFVMNREYPESHFIGFEISSFRVSEASRVFDLQKAHRARIVQVDISDQSFRPPVADYYFIYDFGTRRAIEKVLGDLQLIALTRPICVVGRGRSSRDEIERRQPWLSQVVAPEHHAHYSIYRSANR